MEAACTTAGTRKDLLSMLKSLPPSRELLDFYHAKLDSFEREERQWLERIAEARKSQKRTLELERRLSDRDAEIAAIRKAVVDLTVAIEQERKRNDKLQKRLERTKITEMELRKKYLYVLDISGKRDEEITTIVMNRAEREEAATAAEVAEGFADSLRRPAAKLSRTPQSLRLEIATLEAQLLDQERYHVEQVSVLENERRVREKECDAIREQFDVKMAELANHVGKMESNQDDISQDLIKSRSDFRRSERSWMAEKETLLRKLQLVQNFALSPSAEADGFFTDKRAAGRVAGDLGVQKKIQRLNSELAEQRTLAETYRAQLLSLEAELDTLREVSAGSKDMLKRRTKAMVGQCDALRDRYEDLERRKRSEAEGYATDVKLLQQKMRRIETQLGRAAISKAKEHDYIRTVKMLEKQNEELKKMLQQNPDWRN